MPEFRIVRLRNSFPWFLRIYKSTEPHQNLHWIFHEGSLLEPPKAGSKLNVSPVLRRWTSVPRAFSIFSAVNASSLLNRHRSPRSWYKEIDSTKHIGTSVVSNLDSKVSTDQRRILGIECRGVQCISALKGSSGLIVTRRTASLMEYRIALNKRQVCSSDQI